FAEDPLRVLRVARFAARYAPLGFRVAPDTLALMRELAESGELQHLTAERSWKEISRALMEPRPDVFIRVLRVCGALAERLPEVHRRNGCPWVMDSLPSPSRRPTIRKWIPASTCCGCCSRQRGCSYRCRHAGPACCMTWARAVPRSASGRNTMVTKNPAWLRSRP